MASSGGDPFAGLRGGQPAQQPATQPAAQPSGGASFGGTLGGLVGGFPGAVPAAQPAAPGGGELVIDSSTATFLHDVIEASATAAIIVDFWAPWCGPCKQLGPLIEKVVREQQGRVRLVKINVDENQELARQMRIQSIPAVYAFKDGRPVDGFTGALGESEIRQFVATLAGGPSPAELGLKEAMAEAEAMLADGDSKTAIAIYAEVLAQEPANVEAIAGLARAHLAAGQHDQAKAALDHHKPAPGQSESPLIAAVRAQIELAEQSGAQTGEIDTLIAAVARDPNDHQARLDLAVAQFAAGHPQDAVAGLLDSIRKNREWNDSAARKQLLKIFEALGPAHEVTLSGRRQLSSILFS